MGSEGGDHGRRRIIGQRELTVDGVLFQWWVEGQEPALVNVQTPLLGSLMEFTHGDVEACAQSLARRLLLHRHARAAVPRRNPSRSLAALSKPGWFQPDDIDFGATNVEGLG